MASFYDLDDPGKLKALNAKTYKEQAVWFLNAFWSRGPCMKDNQNICEDIWENVALCQKIDKKGEDGNELDEFQAHQLLEKVNDVLTVKEMRKVLQEIDIDFNRYVSLSEFLIYRYKVDWKVLVNAAQGEQDAEKIEAAEKMLKDAKDAADKAAEDVAKASEDEKSAREAEEKAKKALAHQEDLADQVKKALEELEREEKSYKDQMQKLEDTSNDMTKGIVSRNRAKAELAQMKCKDPLPLQRAKINQEAVVRRQTRATKQAAATAMAAEQARAQAEQSRAQAEESKKACDEAFAAAQKELEKVKAECDGAGKGTLWWLDREFEEAKKYMSQAKLARLAAAN